MVSIRLSEEVLEAAKKAAREQDRSVSWIIQNAVEKYFGLKKEPKK